MVLPSFVLWSPVAALLAVTASAPPVPPERASSDSSHALLGQILSADRIEVHDRWGGLGKRRDRRLELARDRGGGFAGRETPGPGELKRAKSTRTLAAAPREVRLTREQSDRLLLLLASSQGAPGPYRPLVTLDSYPKIEIAVRTPDGTVIFFTMSNGPDYAPWSLQANGHSVVVSSSHPGRALRFLRSAAEGRPAPELLATPAP